jgi:hypothetical protein
MSGGRADGWPVLPGGLTDLQLGKLGRLDSKVVLSGYR